MEKDCPISEHWKDVRKLVALFVLRKTTLSSLPTRGAGKILVINPISIEIVQEIKVGSKPNGLAWDSRRKRLLVADVEDFQARLIDISSGQIISTIKLPGRPRWCVYDCNRDCFLVNIRNPACVSILGRTESALQTAVLPISFEGPHGLDIDKDSDRAFIACDGRTGGRIRYEK